MNNNVSNYNPKFCATLKLDNSLRDVPEKIVKDWRMRASLIGKPSDEIILRTKEQKIIPESMHQTARCTQRCDAITNIDNKGDFFSKKMMWNPKYSSMTSKSDYLTTLDDIFTKMLQRIGKSYSKIKQEGLTIVD